MVQARGMNRSIALYNDENVIVNYKLRINKLDNKLFALCNFLHIIHVRNM